MFETTASPTTAALDAGQRAASAITPAWETEFQPGTYEAEKVMMEDRVSRNNGTRYTLFVFRIERSDGISGRFAYYCGAKRDTELKALRLRLAINPVCKVRLAKKEGVAGMVIDEVIL